MEESHVTFETARLLKLKGFDVPVHTSCHKRYKDDRDDVCIWHYERTENFNDIDEVENRCGVYSCPTQQFALKWLREVHNLHIIICVDDLDWSYNIVNFKNKLDVQYIKDLAGFNSYENAVDSAIQYCLTNII